MATVSISKNFSFDPKYEKHWIKTVENPYQLRTIKRNEKIKFD